MVYPEHAALVPCLFQTVAALLSPSPDAIFVISFIPRSSDLKAQVLQAADGHGFACEHVPTASFTQQPVPLDAEMLLFRRRRWSSSSSSSDLMNATPKMQPVLTRAYDGLHLHGWFSFSFSSSCVEWHLYLEMSEEDGLIQIIIHLTLISLPEAPLCNDPRSLSHTHHVVPIQQSFISLSSLPQPASPLLHPPASSISCKIKGGGGTKFISVTANYTQVERPMHHKMSSSTTLLGSCRSRIRTLAGVLPHKSPSPFLCHSLMNDCQHWESSMLPPFLSRFADLQLVWWWSEMEQAHGPGLFSIIKSNKQCSSFSSSSRPFAHDAHRLCRDDNSDNDNNTPPPPTTTTR